MKELFFSLEAKVNCTVRFDMETDVATAHSLLEKHCAVLVDETRDWGKTNPEDFLYHSTNVNGLAVDRDGNWSAVITVGLGMPARDHLILLDEETRELMKELILFDLKKRRYFTRPLKPMAVRVDGIAHLENQPLSKKSHRLLLDALSFMLNAGLQSDSVNSYGEIKKLREELRQIRSGSGPVVHSRVRNRRLVEQTA